MAKKVVAARYRGVWTALLASNAVSVLLYGMRVLDAENFRYWFLVWNLFLAWLPLGFGWWLRRRLERSPWLAPGNVVLSLVWLGFLPNSFYLVSDLIHLGPTGEVSVLYDSVMFCSFVFNAYLAGFMSLYLLHRELLRRIETVQAHLVAGAVLFACSFAIYLGRVLRWNTWDVLVNPAGLLFDVSDRFLKPAAHPQTVVTTVTFFLLLSTMYGVVWTLVGALRGADRTKQSG